MPIIPRGFDRRHSLMTKQLGFLAAGIVLVGLLAVYTIKEQDSYDRAIHQAQCEILSLRAELQKTKDALDPEISATKATPRELHSMKNQVQELECSIDAMNALLEENQVDLRRLGEETTKKLQNQSGQLFDTVTAGLKKMEGQWAEKINQVSGIATGLSEEASTQKSTLTEVQAALRRDTQEMERTMILPTVQLNGVDTVGSGVLISSRQDLLRKGYTTYVLTSYHVVRNILAESEGSQKPPIRLNVYQDKEPKEELADLVVFDEELDLALLRLRTERHFPWVARLLAKNQIDDVRVFTAVYAVGCPLGNDPIPTAGEIASTHNVINSQNYWMLNAPTYFGNSGGGIYLAKTHEFIALFSKIYTHGHGRPVVIPHMGLATPVDVIHNWIGKVGYAYLLNPETAKTATITAKDAATPPSK